MVETLRARGSLPSRPPSPGGAAVRSRTSWPNGSTTIATTSGRSWRTSRRTSGRTWGTRSASPGPSRDPPGVSRRLTKGARPCASSFPREPSSSRSPSTSIPSAGSASSSSLPVTRATRRTSSSASRTPTSWSSTTRSWTRRSSRSCPRLKFVAFLGIGYASCIDIEAATRRGIVVSNTPDYGATSVAEHCLGMILALTRHIATSYVSLKEGRWEPGRFQGTELRGKTLGLVGLGPIGQEMARLGAGVGMKLVGWTRQRVAGPREARAGPRSARGGVQPLGRRLDPPLAPPGDRAPRVTGPPLADEAGRLLREHGAREDRGQRGARRAPPRPSGSPARRSTSTTRSPCRRAPTSSATCPNALITPHIGYNTHEASLNMLNIAIATIAAHLKGERLHVVNPEAFAHRKGAAGRCGSDPRAGTVGARASGAAASRGPPVVALGSDPDAPRAPHLDARLHAAARRRSGSRGTPGGPPSSSGGSTSRGRPRRASPPRRCSTSCAGAASPWRASAASWAGCSPTARSARGSSRR